MKVRIRIREEQEVEENERKEIKRDEIREDKET